MNSVLHFTEHTKMADVIHRDYRLIPIISRFGLEYGFGNRTISEVCHDNDINTFFFLEIINSFHHQYFQQEQLQNYPAKLIIQYLSNTHQWYLESKIPEIQGYIDQMQEMVYEENQKNIKLLNDFFREYRTELVKHLEKEDKNIFPYVLELEEAIEKAQIPPHLIKEIKHKSIEEYERTHEDMEVKLSDLKNLIIKYLPPLLCKELCQKLLTELFRLESDLEDHSRIEDKVLIPKVKLLEKIALEINGSH
jgi:regulator of cell morphogenesis and NO signaling